MSNKLKQLLFDNWIVLLILPLSYVAMAALFQPGFFTMHDDQQIARLFELHNAITNGQFPVRWVSHLGFGFGYPLFNFYPPFVYYFGLIFYFLGFSLIDSTKIVIGLGFLLATLFMYLWVKKHFGKLAGLTAGILYMYAPYHSVDIYVRGALSEFFSFVWIPAVFWGFDKLAEKRNALWVVLTGILLSFVVLTHNLIALPFLPFLVCYLLYLLLTNKKYARSLLWLFFLVGILSLGLSCFFWLPSLLEKKFTLVDAILIRELASYKIHFVAPEQLWQTAWGYGGSTLGLSDGISLKVGKIHILVSFLAFLSVIGTVLVKKKFQEGKIILCVFLFFAFSLFMTTEYAKPVWDIVTPLAYLQFPWRYLLFAAVFSSFLGGGLIGFFEKKLHPVARIICSSILIVGSVWLMRNYMQPQTHLAVTDEFYTKNKDIEWRISSTSYEYMYKDTKTTLSPLQTTIIDIEKNELPQASYTLFANETKVQVIKDTSSQKEYLVTGAGGTLQVNTNYFPGWKVTIDGKEQKIEKTGKFKVITFHVPEGKHRVLVSFTNTPVRTIGNTITLLTVLFSGLVVFLVRRKQHAS